MKTVGILLINFNSWQETKECLESLSHVVSSKAEIKIVVVDNASKESIKRKQKSTVSLIENTENLGFAGGNNVGIRY